MSGFPFPAWYYNILQREIAMTVKTVVIVGLIAGCIVIGVGWLLFPNSGCRPSRESLMTRYALGCVTRAVGRHGETTGDYPITDLSKMREWLEPMAQFDAKSRNELPHEWWAHRSD